jgi:hypothetical protein
MAADDRLPGGTIPLDTSAAAHRVQRDLYIRMGGAARLAIVFQLNETIRNLAMAGIRRRHPDYTTEEVSRAYARLTLGDDLCRAVWPARPLVEP